ncbi:MAG: hypothetical protein ACRDFX_01120 [Chloroflexota bacterium]
MRSLLFVPITVMLALVIAGCGSSASPSATPASQVPASLRPGGVNHVHAIAVAATNPKDLFMGTHYRLYHSTNGGLTWHPLISQMVLSLAWSASHPNELYALSLQKGLLKSTDGGQNWSKMSGGPPPSKATGVVIDNATGVVFAYGLGIYRDSGNRWTSQLPKESIASVAVGAGGSVYAATGDGLFVSHHDGLGWQRVSVIGTQPVIQVVAAQQTAYADAPMQVFKSTNDGNSWKGLNSPQGINFMGVARRHPSEVFGYVGLRGFMASYDGGKTWHASGKGIHYRNFDASTIQVAPSNPNVVYTGAWGVHFYTSHDGGHQWTLAATLKH